MRFKTIFGFLFILAVAASCITKEKCARFYPPQIVMKDSITIKTIETVTDTFVEIKADSSWLKAWIECDSLGQATIKELMGYGSGQRSNIPMVSLIDNVLTADCKCDSAGIHAIFKNRETTIHEKSEDTITPPAIEVKYIPGWMWFFGISGMIAIGILVLYFGFKIIRLKFF
jgi:hypothetical protein